MVLRLMTVSERKLYDRIAAIGSRNFSAVQQGSDQIEAIRRSFLIDG